MTAILDLSDLVNLITGGNNGSPESLDYFKDPRVAGAAAAAPISGRWSSLWQYQGIPAHGSAPGAVEAPTRATAGAWGQANPGGGREKWLLGAHFAASQAGLFLLYDRLLHIGGLDGTVFGSAQNVGGALSRYTSPGSGNLVFVEIYTQIGATGTTFTISYTNDAGGASVSPSATIGGTGFREAQRMLLMPFLAGDRGVRGVTSITLAASTTTAGNFGVTVARPLLWIPAGNAGGGGYKSGIGRLPSVPKVETDACLAVAFFANTTTALQIAGGATLCEK